MPLIALVVDLPDRSIGDLRNDCDHTDKVKSMRGILKMINASMGPMQRADIRACLATARASQTVGCDISDAVDGTDDITIGGTTLSVEASPSGEAQFDGGTTDAEFAANLSAAINANSTLQKIVFAIDDGVDEVTIYSVYPGAIGHLITLTESGNGFTLGAAALADGDADEVDFYEFGYDPDN